MKSQNSISFINKDSIKTSSFNKVEWDENDRPFSHLFKEHYYSQHNGFRESQHVFIEGNNLQQRWNCLQSEQCFTIMETGFGTGLNFLATFLHWQSTQAQKDTQLHFISIEAYPLSVEQLQRSLTVWQDQLSDQITMLIEQYPTFIKLDSNSQHQSQLIDIEFKQSRVKLTLIFDSLENSFKTTFSKKLGMIDAWFLDGFSPAKNPEMWTEALFEKMAQHSIKGSTVATYTIAGIVRRGLAKVGFEVQRKTGFGTKRDMLYAEF